MKKITNKLFITTFLFSIFACTILATEVPADVKKATRYGTVKTKKYLINSTTEYWLKTMAASGQAVVMSARSSSSQTATNTDTYAYASLGNEGVMKHFYFEGR